MLNQMRLEGVGDLYIPTSDDYMERAEAEKLVDSATRRTICWLLPVICVPKGNPGNVRSLADLARPGMRVTIGDPKSVTVGGIAVAALEKAGL
jgi:molybdate transport system substrate-binding protein